MQFNGDANTDLAKAELRDRIERARPELPDTVDEIYVWSFDDGEPPIMWFAIVAEDQGEDIDYLLEKNVQRRLEAVDGVSRVSIFGLLNDSIRILLDEDKVMAARLDVGNLIQRLSSDNFAQPLGEVDEAGTRYLLRADMRFKDLDEVREYPVGGGLRIGDIASVERVKSVRDWVTRINGGYAFYGMVQREGSANIVELGRELQGIMDGLETDPALGGRLSAEVFFNQADFIENSLAQLQSTAILGGGLAVLILFLFLRRVRMTLCVALAIPASALLALTYEYFRGGSFNVLTMVGLTLAIGMLVDNAVVVVENVARLRTAGHSGKRSAVLGARDVGLAVALATLTSVAVFLPLIFFGGARMQVFMTAMGLPLCASLLFSLLIALLFLPTAASRAIGERSPAATAIMRGVDALLAAPAWLLGRVIGLLRAAWFGCVWLGHWVQRGVILATTPVRLVAAAGLGWVAWSAYGAGGERAELGSTMADFGVAGAGPEMGEAMARSSIALGVVGIGLLLFGLPAWRRAAAAPPARPASFAPEGTSIVGWLQALNRSLLTWTMQHRVLASVLAILAPFSAFFAASGVTMGGFGDDEDQTELAFWVDLEQNFTSARPAARSGATRSTSKSAARSSDSTTSSRASTRRADGSRCAGTIASARSTSTSCGDRLRRELPAFAGHRVYFRGQEEVSDSSKQFVTFELRGPDHVELARLGEDAVELLKEVPGLTDVSSSLTEAPDQILLELDDDVAFNYGVSSQSALRSLSWALRGAQLPATTKKAARCRSSSSTTRKRSRASTRSRTSTSSRRRAWSPSRRSARSSSRRPRPRSCGARDRSRTASARA